LIKLCNYFTLEESFIMPVWLMNALVTVGTLILTLTVTFLFNKLVALPKELKKQREAAIAAAREEAEKAAEERRVRELAEAEERRNRELEEAEEARSRAETKRRWEEAHRQADAARDARIAALEAAVSALPTYRAQSLEIQQQLQATDRELLEVCASIKDSVMENRQALNTRLDMLERREKNAIRAKLLDEYRLFTDEYKNPMKAWSEMEHHAFFELVRDYEDLGGNDFVHSEVLPAVNRLAVVPMHDKQELLKLMNSRKL
jgi:hypothetical protein